MKDIQSRMERVYRLYNRSFKNRVVSCFKAKFGSAELPSMIYNEFDIIGDIPDTMTATELVGFDDTDSSLDIVSVITELTLKVIDAPVPVPKPVPKPVPVPVPVSVPKPEVQSNEFVEIDV